MGLSRASAALAAILLSLSIVPARAQTKILDEVRLGLLGHDVGVFGDSVENGVDVNLEARFVSPGFLSVLYAPRPHLGVSINTDGDTSQAYAGLTWHFALFRGVAQPSDQIFFEFSLGGAVHDGKLDPEPGRKGLGTRFEFRESVEVGYTLTASQSISLMLDHISNANLGHHNAGLDNFGVRYGIKF